MKYNRMISMAILFLLFGTTIPTFAQKGQEAKGGGGGRSPAAQHQASAPRAERSSPQHTQRAEPQRAERSTSQHAQRSEPQRAGRSGSEHAQRSEPQRAGRSGGERRESAGNNRGNNGYQGARNTGNHYGHISDASYRDHFGRGHSFHMMRPEFVGGYNRFHYGGYWFGYNVGWPYGWSYDDDVYVEYYGGGYYMYDLRHPGIRVRLNLFL